jgi:cell division protein FtsW (lipid II flippase)
MVNFQFSKKLDWVLIIIVLLLVSVGLLSIYGISQDRNLGIFQRQLTYVALGLKQ